MSTRVNVPDVLGAWCTAGHDVVEQLTVGDRAARQIANKERCAAGVRRLHNYSQQPTTPTANKMS
jgi:hypothetical protein